MEDDNLLNTFSLQVDGSNIPYLNEAAKWAKFLSILGFILCVMLVLTGIFAGTFLASSISQVNSELDSSIGSIGSGFFAVMCILSAILYVFPSIYLFNFASKMQVALKNNDQINLNNAFRNLKSCFKFWGVLFIIILSFYALVIILSIIGGVFIH